MNPQELFKDLIAHVTRLKAHLFYFPGRQQYRIRGRDVQPVKRITIFSDKYNAVLTVRYPFYTSVCRLKVFLKDSVRHAIGDFRSARKIIRPLAEDDSEDPHEYEPPLVKRRRLERDSANRKQNPHVFAGLEHVAGPSNPTVVTPVKLVRRRLTFTEEQSLAKEDTSSESSDIANPFTSDDEEISYTDLQPINTSTPASLGMTTCPQPASLSAQLHTSTPLEEVPFSQPGEASSQAVPTSSLATSGFLAVPHSTSPLHIAPTPSDAGVHLVLPPPPPVILGKHPIRGPCVCKKNCINIIPQERREEIHASYWGARYNQRRNWLLQHRSKSEMSKSHHNYFLTNIEGVRKEVCLRFFLNTLGYSSNSVMQCLERSGASDLSMFVPSDKRGRGMKTHALNEVTLQSIDDHIEQFNPSVSHYRREHAPNRRYISSDITIKAMFSIFREMYPSIDIGYESYRPRVVSKNISFAKLSNEQCELCLLFEQHEHQPPLEDDNCTTCQEHIRHKEKVVVCRQHYEADKAKDNVAGEELYVSADMQKVTMLPYMTGVKSCAFTNRLVAFHETFAPLGKQKDKRQLTQVRSILWHEGIAGRSAADVTSVFIKAITDMSEEAKHITIWCDNCSGQNKNWILFTSLVRILNDHDILPHLNAVTIKYLETGHTFMSCDSFHGLVERNMRKRKTIYNFSDFVATIQTAGGAPKTIEMQVSDFVNWDRRVTSGKTVCVPKMKDLEVVQFRKSSTFLYYKNSHNDEVFREVEFLMKKTLREISDGTNKLKQISSPRGIPTWKKEGIVTVLCKLMPVQKQLFWQNMPSNDEVVDLTKNVEAEHD